MIPQDRRAKIMEALERRRYLSVDELSQLLVVSAPTVRRDLAELEREGSIRRTHGGASFLDDDHSNPSFLQRSKVDLAEKATIARIASRLVREGQAIGVDQGSTTLAFVRDLARRGEAKGLRVLTNGIPIAQVAASMDGAQVEMPCGTFDPSHAAIVGSEAAEYVDRRHLDVCFVSCSGLHPSHGLTGRTKEDISVKRAFVRNSDRVVLLLDHTKVGSAQYFKAYELRDVDLLVTDEELPKDVLELLDGAGVRVAWPGHVGQASR